MIRRRRTVLAAALFVAGVGIVWLLVSARREPELRRVCADHLRFLSLTLTQYRSAKGTFPTAARASETIPVEKRLSWLIEVTPYFDYGGLYNAFEKEQPWDSPENARLGTLKLRELQCPKSHYQTTGPTTHQAMTSYVGMTGVGSDSPWLPLGHPRAGVFGYTRQTRSADLKDGAASTLLLVETDQRFGPWTAAGPASVRWVDPSARPHIGQGRSFGGLHSRGAMAAFADGSVRFVRDSIDPKVFESLATAAGGEPLPGEWEKKWVGEP